MKIFCMYYDRFHSATTSQALHVEHFVLCHSNANKFTCIGKKGTLIETGQPKGIQNNFNAGLSMLEDGEWGVFLSDDLLCGKMLKGEKFVECFPRIVLSQLFSALPVADQVGVRLVGLNSVGNPFYAKNKQSKYGLVDGRCFAIKKTAFRFHPEISTIPDYYATAHHLRAYGQNLILNHYFLDFKRYSSGGLGSVQDRLEQKRKDVNLMLSLFPDHVRLKDKANEPVGTHIVIKR